MLWKTKPVGFTTITAQEAKSLIDENPNAIILDVRTPPEFASGHIKGAKLMPDYDIPIRSDELGGKDALILIYCRSGARAAGAAKVLSQLGFTNVFTFGGILNWPYEIV